MRYINEKQEIKMINIIYEKHAAMKKGDSIEKNALITVLNEIRTMETLETKPITSEIQYKWFKKISNSRETAIEIYKNNNRMDLYEKEKAELDVIHHYMSILEDELPKQLTDEEVEKIIIDLKNTGYNNIGSIMKFFSQKYPNQNKAKVSEIFKKTN